jgi:hypothetical protein
MADSQELRREAQERFQTIRTNWQTLLTQSLGPVQRIEKRKMIAAEFDCVKAIFNKLNEMDSSN